MSRFKIGDRVTRPIDVYGDHSKRNHGIIVDVYAQMNTQFGDYPELYAVRWDCGHFEKAFLPHGLDIEKA